MKLAVFSRVLALGAATAFASSAFAEGASPVKEIAPAKKSAEPQSNGGAKTKEEAIPVLIRHWDAVDSKTRMGKPREAPFPIKPFPAELP